MKKHLKLLISLCAPLFTGFVGSLYTAPAIDSWYSGLVKPWFTPPSWIFAPAWTTLYILMGIALYVVWTNEAVDARKKKVAMYVFFGHLVLNMVWSIIFFGLQNPFAAFVEIVVLFIAILVTSILFARIRSIAGILFIPYIAWVSFASALNFSIWDLNRISGEIIPPVSDISTDISKCETATGIKIGDEISLRGKVLFNAADGLWYVVERVPVNKDFPYVYAHRKDAGGSQYSGVVFVRGTVTGFDPEDRKVFFFNYPCLPDIEIRTLTQE